jgi:DEAD/DEAH box helicase domain-containing protein
MEPAVSVEAVLAELLSDAEARRRIVHVHTDPARPGRFAQPREPLGPAAEAFLRARGIGRLYAHQARAVDAACEGRDVVVATGTASGKSLCYQLPVLATLAREPGARAMLVFPTKALCQDQFKAFGEALSAAGLGDRLAGVYDGDTPGALRRRLRDRAAAVFTNPDMLHAALMPHHARWSAFLSALRWLVLDELHTYSGIFGANAANLLRRLARLCAHYGSRPQIVACSATVANPGELFRRLTGRSAEVIDEDAAPRGRRTYLLWNPPRVRRGHWRSRRSANVEAHELMARLIERGLPTITFSKAKMTAEMIHRYVREALQRTAPHLAGKVTPYRGGYRPAERREIERRLFDGELLGVSCTRALELGIDVGGLDACILVGYPGTLAGFFQQAGRAGRRERDALVVLVGLDTSVNQYVLSHPEYLFGRAVEQAVVDADNPFVIVGHLRCAAHELPLAAEEAAAFGHHAPVVLRVLEANRKLRRIAGRWYHAAAETPQHEVPLRDTADANVLIEDADSGEVLGQVNQFDAPPILHPEAIYMHRGDTYRVLALDLDKNVATVRREEVDYYTQPLGGTDVHHVDHRLRQKPFGTGTACWGEVTAYFQSRMYEKVHFYSLDAISRHGLDLPTFQLETMALWLLPPAALLERVRSAGLDAHSGLRGIGYATRMLLPLFMTCDTLDFSHSIGAVNAEWSAVFIYERYPLGLGFTERAYERLGAIMPAVLDTIRRCPCAAGCPCCVGKPLRPYATWNVERGEASIPSKASAEMILSGLLGGAAAPDRPDAGSLSDSAPADEVRLERALQRRLERMREPRVFHPIAPRVQTAYPQPEAVETLDEADAARRRQRRGAFHRELARRLARHVRTDELPADARGKGLPAGMKTRRSNLRPTAFPGRPPAEGADAPDDAAPPEAPEGVQQPQADADAAGRAIRLGDDLAARARRLRRQKRPRDADG